MKSYAVDCRNLTVNEEISATLQAKNQGGYSLNYQNPVIYDCRGNGDGKVVPTITGDHQNRVTDYTAILVSGGVLKSYVATGYAKYKEALPTLRASGGDNGGGSEALIVARCQSMSQYAIDGTCSTLKARDYKGGAIDVAIEDSKDKGYKYCLRRLTPLECCRLQGFPDWWENGVGGSDSARFKMWGNGIALPCAVDVLGRIAAELRREST